MEMPDQQPQVRLPLLCLMIQLLLGCSGAGHTIPVEGGSKQNAFPIEAVDIRNGATLNGVVTLVGKLASPVHIDMSHDRGCTGDNYGETVVSEDGKLANVFVYVKSGLSGRHFEVPAEALAIHQEQCRYHPHVAGAMTGQAVQFINDDPTLHNVHAISSYEQWNRSSLPHSSPIATTFRHPEIMMKVKCNQHPWMNMYLSVVDSPFFAVSDGQGRFEIRGLPPGQYTLALVQEKLGEQDHAILVAAGEHKRLDVSFRPRDSENP
jgi:plastocyanin